MAVSTQRRVQEEGKGSEKEVLESVTEEERITSSVCGCVMQTCFQATDSKNSYWKGAERFSSVVSGDKEFPSFRADMKDVLYAQKFPRAK